MGKWLAAGAGLAAIGAVVAHSQSRETEEPPFTVIAEEGGFQVRDYGPIVVAEVTHNGTRRQASSRSFQRLAAYIFAQDRPEGGEAIAMTSPVIQERVASDEKIAMTAPVIEDQTGAGEWRMRFVMPAKYTLATLPPAPADITLTEVPARRMATVTFNGYGSADDLAMMEAQLTRWMEQQGLTPVNGFEYAFYDAPMVPGQYRRNEIMVEIARK
jgi:DNA gyrase inhibitor GyrI